MMTLYVLSCRLLWFVLLLLLLLLKMVAVTSMMIEKPHADDIEVAIDDQLLQQGRLRHQPIEPAYQPVQHHHYFLWHQRVAPDMEITDRGGAYDGLGGVVFHVTSRRAEWLRLTGDNALHDGRW